MIIRFTEDGKRMLAECYPDQPPEYWEREYEVVKEDTVLGGSYLLPLPVYSHGLWVHKRFCTSAVVELPKELFDWEK